MKAHEDWHSPYCGFEINSTPVSVFVFSTDPRPSIIHRGVLSEIAYDALYDGLDELERSKGYELQTTPTGIY